MTDIIFIHALVFKIRNENEVYTPGGIDNNYLARFKDSGFDNIYLVSRSSTTLDKEVTTASS